MSAPAVRRSDRGSAALVIENEQRRDWWKSAVVYQVYPRSFSDSNADGIGDLSGIRQRLDHLTRLGVDVIWLSPICESPNRDNGYDISDYRAIDPTFGTMADFDDLLADVHERGMKLVMDLVVNHTSVEHPWFRASRSGPGDPRRDWYWWRPPRAGSRLGHAGAEPNNWSSFFSGPAWTLDPASGEYYLHLFSADQPDLNWEHPDVRRAVYEMMRWWLDRGIDGFRMDVINFISKDPVLPDGAAIGTSGLGDGFPHFANGPRLHEYLQEMHREVFAGLDRDYLTVGEMPGVTTAEAALVTDPQRHELDMVFHFEHMSLDHDGSKFTPRPLDRRELKTTLSRWQTALGRAGWNSLYWSNHDQPRVVSRFGDDGEYWARSAKMLATVLHLQRGTPYVYQGEELGMTNAGLMDIAEYRDIESLKHFEACVRGGASAGDIIAGLRAMGRDNARTPMQWDATATAGFSDATPWLSVNSNHVWLNAAAQYDDVDSVFNHYRRLIELRHRDDVVVHGNYSQVCADHPVVFAFTRRWLHRELLVLANFSAEPQTVTVGEDWVGARLVLGNVPEAERREVPLSHLGPWEAGVYERSEVRME
ncbi:oligo-1,6-glucosidase [soil metagenome]